jgi:hypothetical protein
MGSSGKSVVGLWSLGVLPNNKHQNGGSKISRCRKDWDADAKAALHESVAGTPENAASTRADAN